MRTLAFACAASLGLGIGAHAATLEDLAPAPNMRDLLGNLEGKGPQHPEGRVSLDAWVQPRGEGRELVVVVNPEGESKLIADPGITLTPADGALGVKWQVPVPHRVVETGVDYWEGERSLRLPFEAAEGTPLDFKVEYAWCVVDYQCFFNEQTLSVANRVD